jgi:hypothetical protein
VRLPKSKQKKLGRWSKAELARLRELYGLRDVAAIARELRRPTASVARAAKSLFPAEVRRTGPWTASEVLDLKRYLGATSAEVIARILGRNVAEVQAQVIELGRFQQGGAWARAEVTEFKRIFGSRTDQDLSRIFARSAEEVGRLAREHGLKKDKRFLRKLHGEAASRMPRWSPEELGVLEKDYPVESNLEIARKLGRSVKSVISKAHSMRLKKSPERLRAMGRENVSVRNTPP